MDKNRIGKKRFKKIMKRRQLKNHKRRVGPGNYYADRINIVCVTCSQERKLHQMTSVGGGLGIGQCKWCIVKLGEGKNEETKKD